MAIRLDEKNLKSGLLGLVVALVEIIQELLERQALRRIEGGSLSEIESRDGLENPYASCPWLWRR